MTEQSLSRPEQAVLDTEAEIFARKVKELIRANDPEVIRVAAEVGASLPHMIVADGELVAKHSLREQILLRRRNQ